MHDTGPGHPERPDRMRAIDKVMSHDLFKSLIRQDAPWRDDVEAAIVRVHPQDYFDHIQASRPAAGSDGVHLDADTVLSPGSWEPAMRAVGAGLMAVDDVITGKVKNAFCQVRPCGHHAETATAMGFCFFNNVAVAARHAQAAHGAERVAIIDWDVHHGNGTQDIFWSDKSVFFASTHQMPLYPGTGALGETGVGNICNAPLRPNDGGEQFRDAMMSRILPALRNFGPDIILISAGFDAHQNDPLANLRLVEDDFGWATEQLVEVAEKHAGGRIVSMLEGGYDLAALARSTAVHVKRLMDA
ncbi:MAG: histone deacetylase family protein [Hyphomicrobiaceae bacterium]